MPDEKTKYSNWGGGGIHQICPRKFRWKSAHFAEQNSHIGWKFLIFHGENISKNPKSVKTADIYEVWEEEEGRCLITSPEKNTKYENKK